MLGSSLGKLRHQFALGILTASLFLSPREATALPSYAQQTGQPCAMCHVGAFGPQLKPFGRAFKLNGYVLSDGKDHSLPLAFLIAGSFTHTEANQPNPAPTALFGAAGPNNNFGIDQASLYVAGRIAPDIGSFIQVTYDGVVNQLHWDDSDIRYVQAGKLSGNDFVAGLTLNNHPTVQDLWNSTPAWAFPYDSADLLPVPPQSALIDNTLAQRVVGFGGYTMWNNWVYAEVDGYQPLGLDVLNALGIVPIAGVTTYDGVMPYWRVVVQHDVGDNYFEVGTYGIAGHAIPGNDKAASTTDNLTDTAFDATYQWTGNEDHFVSAHATYIDEQLDLNASSVLVGSNLHDHLSTFRADLTYSYRDTIVPTIQYFSTWGSNDTAYWGTANGSPDSSGFKAELAYVPLGKIDSFTRLYNARIALQYTAYTRFNGTRKGASGNDALLILLQISGVPWETEQ
jgi:hypothetical protein